MADPLTVAIGVASLVAAAGKSLQSIQNFRTKYKSSDLSALTLKAQCDCILVALGQIQTTLLSKQRLAARLISDESVSGQSLKSVLGACEVTFVIMVDKLSKLNRNFESIPNGISTKDKIARVWNESKINELGQNISRLSDGLNLMLTAFNTKSQLETLEVLTSKRASIILENVVDDASSIYVSDENASLISRTTSFYQGEVEIFSDFGFKDFDFDQEVLMTSAYRKVQQSTNYRPHTAFTAHSAQVETEPNNSSSPRHQAFLHPLTAPDIAYEIPELEAPSVFLKHQEEEQEADSTTHNSPFQTSDDGDRDKGLPERSDPNGTVEVSALVHTENTLTTDIHSRSPLARAAQNAQSYPLWPSPLKTTGNLNTSSVSENSGGTDRRTLYDFLPLNPMPLKSSAPVWQRQKFWITPTEINVIGQNIQDISRHAVDAVHNTLTSLCLSQNNIRSLPKSFGRCQNLEYLNLRQNELKEFPVEICQITSLKTLHISLNEIDILPPGLRNLRQLEFLNIACNCLKALPSFLATMPRLETVFAHGNPYVDPQLQIWQSQHCTYVLDEREQRIATRKLMACLEDTPKTQF